jgi:hypothetical protein
MAEIGFLFLCLITDSAGYLAVDISKKIRNSGILAIACHL